MKKIFLSLLLLVCNPFNFVQASDTNLSAIIASTQRSNEHKSRDVYRHPQQTLEFFEVGHDMTVVEMPDGETWYTEILAPYLKNKGKLYSTHFTDSSHHAFLKTMQNEPQGHLQFVNLQPANNLQIADEGTVDRVLVFHTVHNWMRRDEAANVFNAMYKALKPGGILGVVEHRNAPLKQQDIHASSGYVSEDYVIELARKAGFEFLAKTEINANAKDSKDYPAGVWTLPPTLKLNGQDRQKYVAIGESDCMTVKFVKPAKIAVLSMLRSAIAF